MSLYEDSAFPVRDAIASAHEIRLRSFGAAGTWGTGAQRRAVAAAARRAGIEAGVLEAPARGDAAPDAELPEAARRVIARVAVSPGDIDMTFYEDALAGGLSDAEYVEIVALVAFSANLDVFARSIGVDLRPLPSPEPGAPSRERPRAAVAERAWAPTIPNPPEGGPLAEELYGDFKPYIMRAASLVPDECRAHMALEQVQYMPLPRVLDPGYRHHEGLTRPQAEIVAGRISALNECFY